MNKRQRKKQFKKRFGFNPPRNISTQTATRIMENKESVITACERLKAVINDLLEQLKKKLLELAKAFKEIITALWTTWKETTWQHAALANFQSKVLLQQRQQEIKLCRLDRDESQVSIDKRIIKNGRRD